MPKVNNCPNGGNSPNLVTLIATRCRFLDASNFARLKFPSRAYAADTLFRVFFPPVRKCDSLLQTLFFRCNFFSKRKKKENVRSAGLNGGLMPQTMKHR
jgi:hypothetical protein